MTRKLGLGTFLACACCVAVVLAGGVSRPCAARARGCNSGLSNASMNRPNSRPPAGATRRRARRVAPTRPRISSTTVWQTAAPKTSVQPLHKRITTAARPRCAAVGRPIAKACLDEAEDVFHQCIANGGTPDACSAAANDRYDACVQVNCVPTPTDCEEHCWDDAEDVYYDCLASGGTPQGCAAAANDNYNACVAALCVPTPTDCEDACLDQSEDAYYDCLGTTPPGTPADCAPRRTHNTTHAWRPAAHSPRRTRRAAGTSAPDEAEDVFYACSDAGGTLRIVPRPPTPQLSRLHRRELLRVGCRVRRW